jgi:hypothetical protein
MPYKIFPGQQLKFETLEVNFIFEIHQSFKITFSEIIQLPNGTEHKPLGQVCFELGQMLGRHLNPCVYTVQGNPGERGLFRIYHEEIEIDPFADGPWKDDKLCESKIISEAKRSSNPEQLEQLLSSNVITTFQRKSTIEYEKNALGTIQEEKD